jgi:predicted Fe-S protein YdhL (DUF1289 family)
MYRDDCTVDVLACRCGHRLYPGFPPRSGNEQQIFKKCEMKRQHDELKAQGLVSEERNVCVSEETKLCARCKEVEVLKGTTYCDGCKRDINRANVAAWKAAHPERYAEIQQRFQERRTAQRKSTAAAA